MKATVNIGYKHFVMDVEKAITLLELLDGAEIFDTQWANSRTAYYVYPQDNNDCIRELKILPDSIYRIAKLAGKPGKEQS
jgi:hypothetical protein